MGMTFCPGCGSPLLLETQRFCATCAFDLVSLRERAQQVGAAAVAPPEPVTPDAQSPRPAPPVVHAAAEPVRAIEPKESPPAPAASRDLPAAAPEPVQAPFLTTRSETRSAPSTRPARSRRRPLLALGGLVLVLAVAGVGYVVLTKPGSGSAQPQALGLASPSLDPDAPAFPVPAGSTLINATIEGSGTGVYRLVAWQSGVDYATSAAFYTGLVDSRWRVSGSPATTPQSTDVSFTDSSGVFVSAVVEVDRTDPVRIEVRFLPNSSPPAQSFAPGPTLAFGALPRASALPDGFPSGLVPPGTTLLDAGAIGSTYFALFSGSVDVSAYESQIGSVVTITGTTTQSGSTIINFTLGGKAGQAVIDPASGQVSVELTK